MMAWMSCSLHQMIGFVNIGSRASSPNKRMQCALEAACWPRMVVGLEDQEQHTGEDSRFNVHEPISWSSSSRGVIII